MIIVDHTSTPMDLRFIQGPAKDGAKIKITVKKDKVLVIKSGGNILTSSDITITDTEFYTLVKYSEVETGVTGGAYKILLTGTGGGGTNGHTIQDEGTPLTQRANLNFVGAGVAVTDDAGNDASVVTISGGINAGTIENQHLEWNDSASEWEAQVNLEFGSIGPFADSGFIRYANDQIMLSARNPFDTGNIEIKTDSTLSRVDITDSGQGGSVGLLLRAQDSIDPDQILSLSQGKGIGGDSIIVAPTRLIIDAGIKSFAFALNATELELQVDLDMKTFDIFDIDQLTFMSTVGTLNSLNVGFGALGSGGFRANVLNDGYFEITEENVLHFSFDGGTNSINVIDSLFTVLETVGGTAFGIAKFNGRTNLSDPTELNLQIAGLDIATFTAGLITLADNVSIANVDQIGFRNLGNLIEDDGSGMVYTTIPTQQHKFDDGTNIFATLDIDGLFLNDLYVQYQHIATPTVPGLITQGQVFFNSATNRLSFQRRNDGDTAWIISDLEAAASVPNQIVAGDSSISVVDAGTGAFSFVLDGVTVSTVDSSEWLFGMNLDIDSNNILNPANITLANGFNIENTDVDTTIFAIPNGEELIITEGGQARITVDNNVILESSLDVRLSPTLDIDLLAGNNIVVNPVGEMDVFSDIDMQSGNTVDFADNASEPVGSALGAIVIKVNGVSRLVKFYST